MGAGSLGAQFVSVAKLPNSVGGSGKVVAKSHVPNTHASTLPWVTTRSPAPMSEDCHVPSASAFQ